MNQSKAAGPNSYVPVKRNRSKKKKGSRQNSVVGSKDTSVQVATVSSSVIDKNDNGHKDKLITNNNGHNNEDITNNNGHKHEDITNNNDIKSSSKIENNGANNRIVFPDDKDYIHVDAQLSKPPEKVPTEEISLNVPGTSQNEDGKVNTKALSRFATTYELEKFEKNALLIFNHVNINGCDERLGTERDVEALKSTFSNFGFKIQLEHDLNKDQIMNELTKFTSKDFTEYGCVAVAVLTHGTSDGYIRAKDMLYKESDIIKKLHTQNNATLLTKPRIFILQACRGISSIKGLEIQKRYNIKEDFEEIEEPYTLPVEADMLLLHSSYFGKRSHRHELHGSWFIRTLCLNISKLSPKLDLESILLEVKRDVAIDFEHRKKHQVTGEIDINKQVPTLTSTLIRRLYLRPFGCTSEGAHVVQSIAPSTMVQPYCTCFLEYFEYLNMSMKNILQENHDEDLAQLRAIAETYNEKKDFDKAKKVTAMQICKKLKKKMSENQSLKYLYISESWT